MTDEDIKSRFRVRFLVSARTESALDDRSESFDNKEDAIAYCRSMPGRFNPRLTKIIEMNPIIIPIDWRVSY